MATRPFKDAKSKRDGGAFLLIPHAVLHSPSYIALRPWSKALLIDLAMQYKGDNNGDLCAAWKLMRKRGWRSESTLHNAKQELLKSGFLFETRKGARPNKASLYAVTWQSLDHCNGKLDVTPKSFPRGAYRQNDPFPPLKIVGGAA